MVERHFDDMAMPCHLQGHFEKPIEMLSMTIKSNIQVLNLITCVSIVVLSYNNATSSDAKNSQTIGLYPHQLFEPSELP